MEVYGLQQLARPRGKSDTQLCQKAMGGVKFATGVVKFAMEFGNLAASAKIRESR